MQISVFYTQKKNLSQLYFYREKSTIQQLIFFFILIILYINYLNQAQFQQLFNKVHFLQDYASTNAKKVEKAQRFHKILKVAQSQNIDQQISNNLINVLQLQAIRLQNITSMGCTNQPEIKPLIPEPEGKAIDPLQAEGNIIQNITVDPHIHFYQAKIQQVLLPLRKNRKTIKAVGQIEKFASADKKQHEKYVQCINEAIQKNSVAATNILSFMLEQIADDRQKGIVSQRFRAQQQYAALKCFVYLYTGNYTYKKMNQLLRKSEYQKISTVIGVVKKQLEQYNKQKFARKLKANAKQGRYLDLYRGIPKPDKTMVKGKKIFWRGFTSTSLQRKIANNFGRYHFIIQLDNNNPHDYMIVPKEMSQFDEEEIIIFPYFYVECTNVQDYTSGASYNVKQILPEFE